MNTNDIFTIPADMDVPELRRLPTLENARWLLRNLGVRNSQHPEFEKVTDAIRMFIIIQNRNFV